MGLDAPHTLNHTVTSPLFPQKSLGDHERGLFQSGFSQSYHHKQDSQITKSKIYGLIECQALICTQACGYKFHALTVQQHPTFTAPSVRSEFGIYLEIFGGAFSVETFNLLKPLAVFTDELHC